MTGGATAALLADGRRLHLQHGPIDIVAEAFGPADEVRRAYGEAADRFAGVLAELVGELAELRRPLGAAEPLLRGAVARRMARAVRRHAEVFVTPMAAVAGAVADEVLAAMVAGRAVRRAYVNNGGDIAFHLTPGEHLAAGIVDNQDAPAIDAGVTLEYALPVRGLATSGWRGRSLSFGIADACTVLAADAAGADVAATLIANRVDVDHPAVRRAPADQVRDDTDLGARPVTVAVGRLPPAAVDAALGAGRAAAAAMQSRGLIYSAYLALQGCVRLVGVPAETVRRRLA